MLYFAPFSLRAMHILIRFRTQGPEDQPLYPPLYHDRDPDRDLAPSALCGIQSCLPPPSRETTFPSANIQIEAFPIPNWRLPAPPPIHVHPVYPCSIPFSKSLTFRSRSRSRSRRFTSGPFVSFVDPIPIQPYREPTLSPQISKTKHS